MAKAVSPPAKPARKTTATAVKTEKTDTVASHDSGNPLEELTEEIVREASGVAEESLETAGEQIESVKEAVRQVAESSLDQSRAVFDKLRQTADEMSSSFEESSQAAREALEKMNAVMLESLQQSPTIAFEVFGEMARAGSPPEALRIWSDYNRKQMDVLAKRSEALAEAGQDYLKAMTGPMAESYKKSVTI